MAQYKNVKRGRSSRKVEIRRVRMEVNWIALLLCFLLSFVIWLYVTGTEARRSEEHDNHASAAETAGETTVDLEETAPETNVSENIILPS